MPSGDIPAKTHIQKEAMSAVEDKRIRWDERSAASSLP